MPRPHRLQHGVFGLSDGKWDLTPQRVEPEGILKDPESEQDILCTSTFVDLKLCGSGTLRRNEQSMNISNRPGSRAPKKKVSLQFSSISRCPKVASGLYDMLQDHVGVRTRLSRPIKVSFPSLWNPSFLEDGLEEVLSFWWRLGLRLQAWCLGRLGLGVCNSGPGQLLATRKQAKSQARP